MSFTKYHICRQYFKFTPCTSNIICMHLIHHGFTKCIPNHSSTFIQTSQISRPRWRQRVPHSQIYLLYRITQNGSCPQSLCFVVSHLNNTPTRVGYPDSGITSLSTLVLKHPENHSVVIPYKITVPLLG